MQIVLNKDVKKLGYRGDKVSVKPGYFRNFLMPRGLADIATVSRIKIAESRKEKMVMKKQQVIDNASDVLKKLKGLSISLQEKVTDKNTLYSAVSEIEVIEAVEKAAKVKLEKEHIKMEHIKELGEHKVIIHLGKDAEEEITVVVEAAE